MDKTRVTPAIGHPLRVHSQDIVDMDGQRDKQYGLGDYEGIQYSHRECIGLSVHYCVPTHYIDIPHLFHCHGNKMISIACRYHAIEWFVNRDYPIKNYIHFYMGYPQNQSIIILIWPLIRWDVNIDIITLMVTGQMSDMLEHNEVFEPTCREIVSSLVTTLLGCPF
ncbi:hypothetical protein BDB01DRAFT_832863 [Pilobolus umbonatus]|nr:hypothetical protein BDB01DRAFT_832863 [Pilobolus umbonatus]